MRRDSRRNTHTHTHTLNDEPESAPPIGGAPPLRATSICATDPASHAVQPFTAPKSEFSKSSPKESTFYIRIPNTQIRHPQTLPIQCLIPNLSNASLKSPLLKYWRIHQQTKHQPNFQHQRFPSLDTHILPDPCIPNTTERKALIPSQSSLNHQITRHTTIKAKPKNEP